MHTPHRSSSILRTPQGRLASFIALALALAVCVAHSPAQAGSDSEEEPLVRADLISDVAALEPGSIFHVAVHFRIIKDWGIYWHNPGSTGLATKIDLELPEGLKAGEIRWPGPQRKEGAGGLLDYIYTGETMLLIPVQAADKLEPGASVTIGVSAGWLACKEVCVLGDSDMTLTLPVAAEARASEHAALMREFQDAMPLDLDDFQGEHRIEWDGETLVIEIRGARELTFFPEASRAWRLTDPLRTGVSSTSRIRLPISFRNDDPEINVTGVLAVGVAEDETIYLHIAAPRPDSAVNQH